jgi:Cullin family
MMKPSSAKLVLRPFKQLPSIDHIAAQELLKKLEIAVDQIHQHSSSQLSFEELYRTCYYLVLHKHGEMLYDGISSKLREWYLSNANFLKSQPDEVSDPFF